ncbi:MAG: hypothetical protein EBV86_18330 [Marivivens sp.]|nr:hypothetical protein [Marivivens sp.]
MAYILILFIPITTLPTLAVNTSTLCEEINEVLQESVEDGLITHKEAVDIYEGCLALPED